MINPAKNQLSSECDQGAAAKMLIRFESLKKFQLIWDDVKVTDTDDGGSHPNGVCTMGQSLKNSTLKNMKNMQKIQMRAQFIWDTTHNKGLNPNFSVLNSVLLYHKHHLFS